MHWRTTKQLAPQTFSPEIITTCWTIPAQWRTLNESTESPYRWSLNQLCCLPQGCKQLFVCNNMRTYRRPVTMEEDVLGVLLTNETTTMCCNNYPEIVASQFIPMTLTHILLHNEGIIYAYKSVLAFASIIYYPRFPTDQCGKSSTQSETMLLLQVVVSLSLSPSCLQRTGKSSIVCQHQTTWSLCSQL